MAQLRSAEWAYAMSTGSFADALRASRDAGRAFEAIGDLRTLAVERFGELIGLCELGLFEEAIVRTPPAIEASAALGLHFSVALLRMCFGRALLESGDTPRARRELETSAQWLGPRTPIEWWPRAYLCLADLAEGTLDEAERHALRAVERGREMGHGHAPSVACLARVKLRAGDSIEAVRLVDEALAAHEARAGVPLGDALVRRSYIEVHEAAGNREKSDRQLTIASGLFRARAARIDEAAWRAAFLAAPDVRFVLERARGDVAAER